MAASQESMADLSGSLIERFLDAVQQHPCVYDTKRLDYRDSGRKLNAWERIRLDSGLSTVEECHKLWKRLRDRYTRELKAIESAQRSGSGYVSRRAWEFAESMAFYKECGRPRKRALGHGSEAMEERVRRQQRDGGGGVEVTGLHEYAKNNEFSRWIGGSSERRGMEGPEA
ncbi:hypothetical protein HPB49_002628 [Dermacentor silvarum]|uniref:Uncharacterized protein n=1 Tax=Dermacentor silvarum TaxID=543639 RepID=A0ACB8D210_DERSI|nr:hypothetical protein HPB49_002628 [Dermacentor silvarum]